MNKHKGCECGKHKGYWYRVCFGLNNDRKMNYDVPLYEFSIHCRCSSCLSSLKFGGKSPKTITVTTANKNKFDEVVDILKDFNCDSFAEHRKYLRV